MKYSWTINTSYLPRLRESEAEIWKMGSEENTADIWHSHTSTHIILSAPILKMTEFFGFFLLFELKLLQKSLFQFFKYLNDVKKIN